jgi:biopolymer transport protein ExbD
MADIAFLLIVYFMVTTTFAATRGLDFALPEDDDTPPLIEPEDAVLVAIQGDGTLLVDQRPMLPGEILAYLEPKLSANAKKPVIIQPAPESHYGKMVEVFDELRHGKIIDGKLVWLAKDPTLTQEQLDEGKDINISIPTRREIEAFWF